MQNKKAYEEATAIRDRIAKLLAERSYLEELSYQDIADDLNGKVSLSAIKRHVAFLRAEYRRDGLEDFKRRVRLARQGWPAPYDGSLGGGAETSAPR